MWGLCTKATNQNEEMTVSKTELLPTLNASIYPLHPHVYKRTGDKNLSVKKWIATSVQ